MKSVAHQTGYSLVEVIIVLLIFTSMFMLMLSAFQNSIRSLNVSKARIVGVEIANAQMEILRNISYADLGTTTGSPTGTIPATQVIQRSNTTFTIRTSIMYVDDPFDGCAGEVTGEPNQSLCADGTIVDKPRDIPANGGNPADYKKADITVTWDPYFTGRGVQLSTILAPEDLEGDTDKGFLLIKVIDANGSPVPNADVHVTNTDVIPNVELNLTSDVYGTVLLLDLEPSIHTYHIVVTKSGYSTDRTCATDAGGTACTDTDGVPNPLVPLVSVYQGEVETAYFVIDRLSTISVNSFDQSCVALGNIDFTLESSLRAGAIGKKVSTEPLPDGIVKTSLDFTGDGSGQWFTDTLEWDYYDLLIRTAGYFIAGINHNLALNILPNTSTALNVLLAPATTNALLVTVHNDAGVGVADVTVELTKTSEPDTIIETKITGQGFVEQSNWTGGGGQSDMVDYSKYYSDNGFIDYAGSSGQVTLTKNTPALNYLEDFSTSSFKDAANTTADWNTSDTELKLPTSGSPYPLTTHYAQTNTLNTQNGKIVSATLTGTEIKNADHTIQYLLSADGGLHFEPVTLNDDASHIFTNVGNDLRIRVQLATTNAGTTPVVQDIALTYSIEYYDTSGELTSSTFDLGSMADFSNFYWELNSQPAGTSLRFQLAANNDNTTWNFIGPDGTDTSYYTINSADVHASLDGNQYLRYKVFFETTDEYYTPTFNNIRIGYTLECLPPGQVYFSGLDAAEYGLNITADGFTPASYIVNVSGYTTYITQPPIQPL